MKTADFAAHLTEFLSHYLPELKNISTNTISSYCDAFRLFLGYCQDVEGMRIEKLSIDDLTPELVDHFLQWLRIERNNGTATRSQRLAAIRSFVKYLQIKEPRLLLNFQQILAIPVKRAERKAINPLTKEAIALILRQPDTSTLSGRRDATISCRCRPRSTSRPFLERQVDDEYCGIYPTAMMMESDGMNRKTKTICIHVDEERLKELHIRAAQSQKSLQDYVTDLIRKDLCPYQQSSLLPEQKAALNDLSKEALSVVEKMEDILRPEQQEHGGMRFG